ncbi:MAG: heme-binding protein [Inquilinus sp.]|nr:heme-binding protein [Inquilinus sp.]
MAKHRIALAAVALCLATTAQAEEEALIGFEVMAPQTALELAQAAMESCRGEGFQVAVAVVDRFGLTQVVLRDRFAGPHTVETAQRKAWTAVSFRTATLELEEGSEVGGPIAATRHIPGALMLGGGVPVESAGSIVGGIGISGAPGGDADDACARAAIDALVDKLGF